MDTSSTGVVARLKRRLWMKFALRGVGGSDNHGRLDLAYGIHDPWHMESDLETARFEATNAIILRAFGRVGSLLELGCGEGHQTAYFSRLSDHQFGIDVSQRAVLRAQQRLPAASFAVGDIFNHPWAAREPFDLVTACEMLYYLGDPAATIARMRTVARNGVATFFSPAGTRLAGHFDGIPGLQRDWIQHGQTTWLVAWWRDEGLRD